ncbi:MAG: DUF3298 domain-containing protein [Bacteroidaceae bacterium]|nr:DUF3298 domain-containing protein [Bacteroidaceae bacterium]
MNRLPSFVRRAFPLLGMAVMGLAVVSLASCEWGRGTSRADDEDVEWCTAEFEDSISVLDARAYQRLQVDFPQTLDSAVADKGTLAAFAWIRHSLPGRSFPGWDGDSLDVSQMDPSTIDPAVYGDGYLKACGQQGLERMQQALQEFAADGFEGGYLNHLTIELQERTPDYLTLSLGHETYLGGAHGGYHAEGITFRRTDGAMMGWNLFDMSRKAELVALIKEGLKEYFSEGSEETVVTDEQLYENLILWDDPETEENELELGIPLPATAPWVTRRGVSFIYQQYEIAAYACGLPSMCFPVEKVAPLLSAEGKALLGV